MSWQIYKPGQGYWTRMVSGIAGGVFVVAGALWVLEKLSTIQNKAIPYVQGVVALVVIGVFGSMIYKWVAVKPRTGDFLIATEGEMKKVNWPVRREVIGSTWVVVWCVVLLFTLLFLSDVAFTQFFQLIGIMEKAS